MITLYKKHINKKVKYLNVEKDIFDQEWDQTITIAGIFTTKSSVNFSNIVEEKDKQIGFKNK